jgi:hypothetical protein
VNVAFLANSFHLTKTKSVDFLISLMREWFGEVAVIPHKEAWARLPGTRWDLLVAFQHLYRPEELEAFGARTTVLVPMFDDCPQVREFWLPYRGFKVLSFSRTLGSRLEGWGLEVCVVQYWQPPTERPAEPPVPGLRGFFWPRTLGLGWGHIKALLGDSLWQSFHLHLTNPEGAAVLPTDQERLEYSIVQTDWFEDPAEAKRAVARANVYFAPRRYEGIGQAVLEALSLGLCVVAPDLPTMNEYIIHGENGLLYNPDHPHALDFTSVDQLGRNARASAERGFEAWERALPGLRSFLEKPARDPRAARFHPVIRARGRATALLRTLFRLLKRTLARG